MAFKVHDSFKFQNGMNLKNRFVLAPMTNCQSLDSGKLGLDEFMWLKQYAEGGFGLITTCASYVTAQGKSWPNQLSIHDDINSEAFKHLNDTLHSYNAKCVIQLFHGGARAPSLLTHSQPVSASAFELNVPNFEKPRELSVSEIKNITDEFISACVRAQNSGFDGAELHGANGYLITQFISTQTNLRQDEYGGSFENRCRFLLDIIKGCRQNVRPDFILGVRLSPENMGVQSGLDFKECLMLAQKCKNLGCDYISISTMNAQKNINLNGVEKPMLNYFREYLEEDYPLIIAGGLKTIHDCENAINLGASLVALGRIALGNPYFPLRSLNEFYNPNQMPFNASYLKRCSITDNFLKRLVYFEGLIA